MREHAKTLQPKIRAVHGVNSSAADGSDCSHARNASLADPFFKSRNIGVQKDNTNEELR
jgi:hypothetical protein